MHIMSNKQKTPLMKVIERLDYFKNQNHTEPSIYRAINVCIAIVESHLPEERQNIIDTFTMGKFEGINMTMKEGEQYFNETYENHDKG